MVIRHKPIPIGQRFGRLVVVGDGGPTPSHDERLWLCRCDCGTEKGIRRSSLLRGCSNSCGCFRAEELKTRTRRHSAPAIGQRFGRWTVVIQPPDSRANHSLCRCDCGAEKLVRQDHLRTGKSASCGCLRNGYHSERLLKHGHSIRAASRSAIVTHGKSGSTEYETWLKMRARCRNPKDTAFKDYGARGITICERWNDFSAFYADMGPRPSPDLWIERRDNDGPYSPENCYWATKSEQANNKRNTVWIDYRGKRITLTDAVRMTGIRRKTLRQRIYYGWTGEQIIETPVRRR